MTEHAAVDRGSDPLTVDSITQALRQAGVPSDAPVLVHTSLSALGWVCGGAHTVIEALQTAATERGTLLMPTFTNANSDPQQWRNPPVPKSWWQTIRDHTPAYDPARSPTRGMGQVPELFRRWPDVVRSDHPMSSFAAWGAAALAMTVDHPLDYPLGAGSPLDRLYERDGWVLLLGVGHGNNTSLHLCEARAPGTEIEKLGSAMSVAGERTWVEYLDYCIDAAPFPEIGAAFERDHPVTVFELGVGTCRLMKQRPLVDFGVDWLTRQCEP